MATMLIELRVEMDNGDTHDVVADQRDVARWEVQEFGTPFNEIKARANLAYRWLAWSAMSRRGLTALSWSDFDATCLEVSDLPEPDEAVDPGDRLDPGQPAPSDSTS